MQSSHMHIPLVSAFDGPLYSYQLHQYKSEFVSRCFTGFDGIDVSNDGNCMRTERLTYTVITSYLLTVQYLRDVILTARS